MRAQGLISFIKRDKDYNKSVWALMCHHDGGDDDEMAEIGQIRTR